MKACQNCKYGDPATDPQGQLFVWCRLIPPRPLVVSDETGQRIIWVVPDMKATARCGQHRLSLLKWLASFGRRGT